MRTQSRNARTGSIRVARQAGRKQAANEMIVMIRNAGPNASGSRGFTLYRRSPISGCVRCPSRSLSPPATRCCSLGSAVLSEELCQFRMLVFERDRQRRLSVVVFLIHVRSVFHQEFGKFKKAVT